MINKAAIIAVCSTPTPTTQRIKSAFVSAISVRISARNTSISCLLAKSLTLLSKTSDKAYASASACCCETPAAFRRLANRNVSKVMLAILAPSSKNYPAIFADSAIKCKHKKQGRPKSPLLILQLLVSDEYRNEAALPSECCWGLSPLQSLPALYGYILRELIFQPISNRQRKSGSTLNRQRLQYCEYHPH